MNPLVKIRQYRMRPINKQAARVINDSFDETFSILPGSRRPANKAKAKKHGRRFNHPRRKQKQLCQYVNC